MKPKIILLISIVFFVFFSFADILNPAPQSPQFSVQTANKTLDSMRQKLSANKQNSEFLQKNLAQLQDLNQSAERCVSQGEAQLKEVNSFALLLDKKSAAEKNSSASDMKYLQDKKDKLQAAVADCRLFMLRSTETTQAYNAAIQQLSAGKLFEREASIWQPAEPSSGAKKWGLSPSALHLLLSLIITVLGALFILALWRVHRSEAFEKNLGAARYFITAIIGLLLLVILVAQWLAYVNLAHYLMVGLIKTLLLLVAVWFLSQLVFKLVNCLDFSKGSLVTRIRHYLGVKPQRRLPELWLLKMGLLLIILGFASTLFLRIWQWSKNAIDAWDHGLTDGFVVLKIYLVPLKIAVAMLVFSLLILLGRWCATRVAQHQQFRGVPDTQVAMASIVTYVFFALALLFSLLVSGVDFTGLAIVAGALSVGAGLGLQSSVNNFVSGLILLIEKPIKPGDRIIVGANEGFVKKVSIRSTRITTTNQADLIVPNADLVTKEVTNFTFRDRYWRLTSAVGVAYGSDVELVRKLLLEIAYAHPGIVTEGEPSLLPRVIFKAFGEIGLQFELSCVVKDVNSKTSVLSDLNFAIYDAFRKHEIVVPFKV